ncbi:DUF2971 domain-containing protein [Flagellimonas pelagia]|uniref:DUF2971 domain-containing protein n=1 Tax=Flagellimonas pelagia TaxID=2306998 RepID=A0A3A1NDL2_9FLAO|nr:DUF2971 domain-containing protein [Allomuricauda maritima]RIV42469.1 DUF2971 domain-containing protein [Allomuricauda maritima]TXJ91498.1 DUF2971 domain-containing protein [Allomuricauda maritima]
MSNWKAYNTSNPKSKYLLRFLSEEKLNLFLKSGSIWFPRAIDFGDPLECITAHDLKSYGIDFKKVDSRKKKYLVSCWHEATYESVAMWDTYSVSKEGRRRYAIRFKKDQLIQYVTSTSSSKYPNIKIDEFMHGSVRYKNMITQSPDLSQQNLMKRSVFRKEYAFKYEKEFRFVIRLHNEAEKGFALKIGNIDNLQFDILVNPLLPDNEYIEAKDSAPAITYKNKVIDSRLAKWFKPHLNK